MKSTPRFILVLIITLIQITGSMASQLWGVTTDGGNNVNNVSHGTIFKMNLDGSGYTIVHSFNSRNGMDGTPGASLVQGPDNMLYGTTVFGGINDLGVIYKIDPNNNAYTELYHFDGATGACPGSKLVMAPNGLFYGMANSGGANTTGVLFSFNPANNTYVKIIDFNGTTGALPDNNSLLLATDGNLYGLTTYGGTGSGQGTLFRFNPSNNVLTVLKNFNGAPYDASYPGRILVQYGSVLYGTSLEGGSCNLGTVFQYNLVTGSSGLIMQFCGSQSDFGKDAYGELLSDGTGNFYGLAKEGGVNSNSGVMYKFSNYNPLHSTPVNFSGVSKGSKPAGGLIKAANKWFYGVTWEGGSNGLGTIFKYNPLNNQFTKLHDFTGPDGKNPYASLLEVFCTMAPPVPGTITAGNGTAKVCPGDIRTYSVSNFNTFYDWTTFTGADIIGGQGTATITVSYTSAFTTTSGVIHVSARNACGSSPLNGITVLKNFPATPGTISGSPSVCANQSSQYAISAVSSATNYVWNWPKGAVAALGNGGTSVMVSFGYYSGYITVKSSNACGLSSARSLYVNMNCREGETGASDAGLKLNVFPNPAYENVHVSFHNNNDASPVIRLMDETGRIIATQTGSAADGDQVYTFETGSFSKGIYQLELTIDGKKEYRKLMIQ